MSWSFQKSFRSLTFLKRFTKAQVARVVILSSHTRSKLLRLTNLLINTVLFVFAVDLVVSPLYQPTNDLTFARIGAVQPDSVKVLVRYPQENATKGVVTVRYRPAQEEGEEGQKWLNGPSVFVSAEDDWIGAATISSLWPSTKYECKHTLHTEVEENLTNLQTDILVNSTLDVLPYPSTPLTFKTFPDHRLQTGSYFRFVSSSCLKQNFPYFPGSGSRIKGFDLLSRQLPSKLSGSDEALLESLMSAAIPEETQANSTDSPVIKDMPIASAIPAAAPLEFLLLLGDFIYADVPYYSGDNQEAYRRLYRQSYASSSFRKIYETLRKSFLAIHYWISLILQFCSRVPHL